ncbi:MAG TPA: amino acid adenylation domain-containing protein [Ktedonobacteraceae bacterium]|nr:amino acid adenylation domain-containing protein [Ktedonobacteraceae bacterium]
MYSKQELHKRREGLSAHKKDLLAQRLQRRSSQEDDWQAIPRRAEENILPPSFAQRCLWFLQQLEPENPVYNETLALRLTGRLNREILQLVLHEIARRHEILRTTFTMVDGDVQQMVHPPDHRNITLSQVEWSDMPVAQRESAAINWMQQQTQQTFMMTDNVLWKATLLHLSSDEHILFIVLHHIICDSWSLGLFMHDLAAIYPALSQGRLDPLPVPIIQYGDYLLWQRQHFAGNTLETLLSYWKKHLAGSPALLELPTDHPRQPRAGYQARRLPFQFSAAQTHDIHIAINQEGITLFMLLLTALAITLARYSRQDEVVIGTPVAGRTTPELEAVFGLFVNMLALRINLTGNPTLHAIMQQVRAGALAAYAHQDMPFEKLVEEMHVQRLQGQSPFFQVVLDLQHSSLQQAAEAIKEVDGIRIVPIPIWNDRAKFDLTFVLNEHEQKLNGQLIYNSDLWDASSMQRLLAHWQRVIQALVIKPEQRLSQVSMLSAIERAELLARWSKPLHPLDTQSIPQLFELQVARTPESIALVSQDTAFTYLELNRHANRLAHCLHQQGVLPGTPVGAHLERSPALIIALLAILKVGGIYVPLDPVYPPERLSLLLQDCAIAVLLTQKRLYPQLSNDSATALVIDAEAFIQEIALQRDENLACWPDQQLPAYTIYTSGTTGKPKGVYVTQQAAANHLLTMQKTFGISQGERVLLFATSAFDVSLEQTLTPLISGATLVLKDPDLWHTHDLTRQIATMALTVVNLPTAYWHQWVSDMRADTHDELLTTLKLVIAGGDKVVPEMVRLWFQMPMSARIRLLNAYGPTEATITTSVFAITAQMPDAPSLTSMPIGSPLPNRTYYVLDNYGEPVPSGVIGELYIGGPLLACGYLHRPALTAEHFVPDPFGGEPGARLYRTGDLVRAHHNGNLEVLGRADLQVKIRGFRIELGEIEAALTEHPQVREAAVVARAGQQEKYLVAYVVPACKSILDVTKLYQYLVGHLPRYMVPAHIVPLDALPLTSNGKLDRQTLAHLVHDDFSTTQTAYIAPQTPMEAALAAIWCDLLSVPQVGRYDNFFTSGGHSLLAIRLVSRIFQVLHINCPLSAVFECPTLATLAEYLLQCREEEGQEMLASILENDHNRSTEQEISLPLSFHQQRLWFLDQLQPGNEQYNLSVAVRLDGPLDIAALERSLNALIERHESLRTVFIAQEEPQQVVLPTLTMTLKQQALQQHQDTREIQAQQLIQAEAHRPFKLAEGPLLRVLLLQMQTREYILLLTMHHIICDGWSIGILFKELLALYTAFSRGESSPLTPLNVQYRHYARWQRLWLQGERFAQQLAYWQQQLQNAPPLLALPTDYPRTANAALAGSQQSVVLASELVDQLQALSQSEHVTLFVTLLAAIKLLLYRMSGQDDIVVGVPHLGRPRVEFEQVVGLFANMLPLRTDLSGSPTFKQLLARVHNVSLAALTHADVPFEQIVQALHIEPASSYHPLFQVEVAFQNDLLDAHNLSRQSHDQLDLSIRGVEVNVGKVKLDLAFAIAESERGLFLTVEYSTDLFTEATITRMLGYLQSLLSEIVLHPEQSVTRLPLLSDAERRQLLNAAQHDAAVSLPEENFYQLFSKQAERTPEALAIIDAGQQITYRELEQAGRQLANSLSAYSIGPEVIVALLAERSANFLITILALFRLGAAYLPLDPRAPSQRQQQLIAQSRAVLLLVDHQHAASLPTETVDRQILPPVMVIEDLLAQSQQRSEECLSIEFSYSRNQLAYVIYTSGSTGVPKGAMIEQRGMLNHLYAKIAALNLSRSDIVAQTASQCFDISVWQLLAPLLVGGGVHIIAEETAHDPTWLLQHMQQNEITVFETVPSLLRAILDEIVQGRQQQPSLSSLRWLLLTGEALRADLCLQWHLLYPHIQVMNAYGPTECSDDVTHYALPAPLQQGLTTVPIGRAIANMQVYVLDPEMQPVPPGVIGEVYCGGVGVGRGYLYDPCRTAASYLPHPFVGTRFIASSGDLSPSPASYQPGARLYKTGDLARILPDGSFEYCGRVDQQLKIRGFRIEPGEIEKILRQQQAVCEAVVTSKQSQNNDASLVAYIVLQPQQELEIDKLIYSLKEQLPAYMLPAHFVQLPSLPFNANGKIDYAALPEPERGQQRERNGFIAPRSVTEQVIASIWAGALELDPTQLSIHESFFSLGGHSLLATRVMARLRSIFPADLSLRSFFEHPTIAEFAQFLLTHETKPGHTEKIARIFQRIDGMKENEFHQLLQSKRNAFPSD